MFRYRNYDYTIGRFFGVDPITEKYTSISPYQFAHNSPAWKIELEGLEGIPTTNIDVLNDEQLTSAAMETSLQVKLQQNQTVVSAAPTHTVTATYEIEGRTVENVTNTIGTINTAVDNIAAGIESNVGNTRIGSNNRLYLENPNGGVFQGNQHVSTSSIAGIASDISKYTGPVGDVIDAVNLGNAIYQDGGIGQKTVATAANIGGGAIGAEVGAWAGAEMGALMFAWSGPGAVVAGVVGGIVGGAVGGYYGGEAVDSLLQQD